MKLACSRVSNLASSLMNFYFSKYIIIFILIFNAGNING